MKSFVIKLHMLLGEYEKSSIHLVRAETREIAEKRAIEMESHNEPVDIGNGGWGDDFFVYRVDSVKEVSYLTFEYLKEYIQ